ncbi:MAG: beta-galactosidase [Armatimonadota bacterium]|nr:beta-galactosidase [Armatimonadota bacterium]
MLTSGWAFGQNVVGIWHEPSVPKQTGQANPQRLANLLRQNGFAVRLLSSSDLTSPQILTPQKISIVILPYGAYFPAEAVDNFRSYLKAGGRFISLGGYAFDETWDMGQGAWGTDLNGSVPAEPKNHQRNSQREGEAPAEPKIQWRKWRWEKVAHEKVQVSIERNFVRIVVPKDAPVDWHCVRSFLPMRTGWRYLLTGKVKTEGITNGHGAYLAADYFDANGNRISFQQTQIVKRTKGWQELGVVLRVPKEATKVAINAIVHGHGVAEFSDIVVKPVINARWGDARDALHIDPEQFAIFDPSFRIDGATVLEWNTGQGTRDTDKVVVQTKEPMKGYTAVALIGSNDPVNPKAWARLVPVLVARDKFGRYLGPAFSILHHFAGPYASSTWAFCGIESHDLTQQAKFQTLLVQVARYMLRGVYLHSLRPSFWTYRKGETANIIVKVRNDGVAPQTVTVRIEIAPMKKPLQMGKAIVVGEKTVTVSQREQRTVTMNWRIPQNAAPLYAIRAILTCSSRFLCPVSHSEIWSGFCVWDENVLRSAMPIAWQDNALCEWDDENKTWQPRFWLGTNQTGVMFAPEATWENPLQWEFEFSLMRKMGLNVLRVLHISHFAGDLENPSEEFWRRYDALVLMAHRHGLVLMPTLHEWMGVSVSDETLRKQCAFVRLVGSRYKNARRIIWDIENEAWVEFRDHPDLHRLFNEWLRQRYGSDEKLQRAWRENVKLGEVRYAEHKPKGWDDLKFRDIQHFRRWLIDRWVKANVQALRESGAKQPVTDEIDWKVCGDHYEASKWLDFVNLHYYGDRSPNSIATYLKFHDRHFRGQGLAVGEFGARDHPSFRFGGWGYAKAEEVIRHFVNMPLLTFGLEGEMALNWDWKDMEACIFPWGLVHQHGIHAVTRDTGQGTGDTKVWEVEAALKVSGKAFAAVAKFLGQFRPHIEPRKVALVVPDEHLLGAEGEVRWSGLGPEGRISAAVFNAIEALMRLKVPFGVVREWELAGRFFGSAENSFGQAEENSGSSENSNHTPPEIAVFPIPFVWSDETYKSVKRFVERGGIAVITGDFTFDLDRNRTRTNRLQDLFGFEFVDGIASPFELEKLSPTRCVATEDEFVLQEWWGKPCVRMERGTRDKGHVIALTKKGEPVVVARKLGRGLVLFCADAPEFRNVSETVKVYRALLKRAAELYGMSPERIDWILGGWVGFGRETEILVFGQADGSHGWIFVAANPNAKTQYAHFLSGPTRDDKSRLTISPNWTTLLKVGTHSEPAAVLFANDFWGVGYRYREHLLGNVDIPTAVWGELPNVWIGALPMHFIPLGTGSVRLSCRNPTVTLTVCDLVTGKAILQQKAQAKDGWLQFHVPQELVLTEWRISD